MGRAERLRYLSTLLNWTQSRSLGDGQAPNAPLAEDSCNAIQRAKQNARLRPVPCSPSHWTRPFSTGRPCTHPLASHGKFAWRFSLGCVGPRLHEVHSPMTDCLVRCCWLLLLLSAEWKHTSKRRFPSPRKYIPYVHRLIISTNTSKLRYTRYFSG